MPVIAYSLLVGGCFKYSASEDLSGDIFVCGPNGNSIKIRGEEIHKLPYVNPLFE